MSKAFCPNCKKRCRFEITKYLTVKSEFGVDTEYEALKVTCKRCHNIMSSATIDAVNLDLYRRKRWGESYPEIINCIINTQTRLGIQADLASIERQFNIIPKV